MFSPKGHDSDTGFLKIPDVPHHRSCSMLARMTVGARRLR